MDIVRVQNGKAPKEERPKSPKVEEITQE